MRLLWATGWHCSSADSAVWAHMSDDDQRHDWDVDSCAQVCQHDLFLRFEFLLKKRLQDNRTVVLGIMRAV